MPQKLNVKISETSVKNLTFGNLTISKIEPQFTHIENIILEGLDVNVKPSAVRLEGVKVGLTINCYIEYKIGVCIHFGRLGTKCWGWSDNVPLASLFIPKIGVHDMVLTMDKIPFHLDQVAVGPMEATIKPINNLNLGGGQAFGVNLQDMQIPEDWFTLTGIGVGSVSTTNIQVSTAKSRLATVNSVPNLRVAIPSVELPEITIGASSVGAESGSVSTQAEIEQYCTPKVYFPFGWLRLCAQPIAYIDIDRLKMDNIILDAIVNRTVVKNVTVPMNLTGLIIKELEIKSISVPKLNLEKLTP